MKPFKIGTTGILGKTISVIQSRSKGTIAVYEYIFTGDKKFGQQIVDQMNEAREAKNLKQWLIDNDDKFERYSI